MLASIKRNMQSHNRTGDGRVRQPKADDTDKDFPAGGRTDEVKKPGRSVGDGAQALGWGRITFTKSPAGGTSVSTSPETDPGNSDLFPFFKGQFDSFLGDDEVQ